MPIKPEVISSRLSVFRPEPAKNPPNWSWVNCLCQMRWMFHVGWLWVKI